MSIVNVNVNVTVNVNVNVTVNVNANVNALWAQWVLVGEHVIWPNGRHGLKMAGKNGAGQELSCKNGAGQQKQNEINK